MKRLILFFLLIPALCFADMNPYIAGIPVASSSNTEIGYTTIGGTSQSSNNDRGIEITVPAGGLSISHAWVYGSSLDSPTFQMAILTTGGVQQGACSTVSSTVTSTPQWWEVTFSTPISLSAGTYILQYHATGAFTYYYDSGSYSSVWGSAACGTLFGNATTEVYSMSCANYDAR